MLTLSAYALAVVAAGLGLYIGLLLASSRLADARREAREWRTLALDLLDAEPADVRPSTRHSASLRVVP